MSNVPRNSRRHLVIWILLGLLVVVASGLTWWGLSHRSEPVPQFAPGSDIRVRVSASIPPEQLHPSAVHLSIGSVSDSTVRVYLDDYDSGEQVDRVLGAGDTLRLGDVVLRACAVWEDKSWVSPWDRGVGGGDDKLYYVYSTDGSAPECPDLLD